MTPRTIRTSEVASKDLITCITVIMLLTKIMITVYSTGLSTV